MHDARKGQTADWLSILMRKVIGRSDFASVKRIIRRVSDLIHRFNATLVKSFRCTHTDLSDLSRQSPGAVTPEKACRHAAFPVLQGTSLVGACARGLDSKCPVADDNAVIPDERSSSAYIRSCAFLGRVSRICKRNARC
jgi:hypothetical protein